jgi:hypothetical protein
MKIFVHHDQLYGDKWHERYVEILSTRYGVETELVDFLTVPMEDIVRRVSREDGLVGRFGHVTRDVETLRSNIDALATIFNGRMFPAPHTYLYYDNKARQASLFANRGYPTPATAVVRSVAELEAFLDREGLTLPIIVKAFHGAQSKNVHMLVDLRHATFPCIAQRYCPGNPGDYRIVVIGHRVMGFMRRNRQNDFRASGSGDVVFVEELDRTLVELATWISRENNFESMAYDFVKSGNKWVVLEMSYTYPHWSLLKCDYFYDTRTGKRVSKTGIYPEEFIVEDFLSTHYPQRVLADRRQHIPA